MQAKRFSQTKIDSDTIGMPTHFDEEVFAGVNAWRPTLPIQKKEGESSSFKLQAGQISHKSYF